MSPDGQRIVIIGGGFSGTMLAARMAEVGQASVVIDSTGTPGLGVAYSTPFEGHLLNVRSARMSALAAQPDHFTDWLARHSPDQADPEGFAPRRLYGAYIQDRLAAAQAAHPGVIEVITGRAVTLDGNAVVLDDGQVLSGRAVVLATGNPAPRGAVGRDDPVVQTRLIRDPWAPGGLSPIGPEDSIAIIGTGLTMVDIVLGLIGQGWRGDVLAVSRRGLKPRAHTGDPEHLSTAVDDLTSGPLSRRLNAARSLSHSRGWHAVMEGLRPLTANLWQQASVAERQAFLRHLRPWWDVHRHRIAPQIAAQIEALIAAGRLIITRGRVLGIERLDPTTAGAELRDQLVLTYTSSGDFRGPRRRVADWIIDGSGPGHNVTGDPLTGQLIACGQARLDPLGLGLDLDGEGRVVRGDGSVHADLFVLGPPARAAFWETIAVPDIRLRIENMTRTLTETLS